MSFLWFAYRDLTFLLAVVLYSYLICDFCLLNLGFKWLVMFWILHFLIEYDSLEYLVCGGGGQRL